MAVGAAGRAADRVESGATRRVSGARWVGLSDRPLTVVMLAASADGTVTWLDGARSAWPPTE